MPVHPMLQDWRASQQETHEREEALKGKKRWQDLAAKSDYKLHVDLASCNCQVTYLSWQLIRVRTNCLLGNIGSFTFFVLALASSSSSYSADFSLIFRVYQKSIKDIS